MRLRAEPGVHGKSTSCLYLYGDGLPLVRSASVVSVSTSTLGWGGAGRGEGQGVAVQYACQHRRQCSTKVTDCTSKASNHRTHRNAYLSFCIHTRKVDATHLPPHSSSPCRIQQPTSLIKLANECELPLKQGLPIQTMHCTQCTGLCPGINIDGMGSSHQEKSQQSFPFLGI